LGAFSTERSLFMPYFSWRITRRQLVGSLIVLQLAALCVIPVWSRGADRQTAGDASPHSLASSVRETFRHPAASATDNEPLTNHVVETQPLSLVLTSYRLSAAPARTLTQFLEEYIGRPEVFEIRLEEPDVITVVASPAAQKTIGELVVLIRNAHKEPPGSARASSIRRAAAGVSR
jgi:hypothetical protein